jgi:hypothetical protein
MKALALMGHGDAMLSKQVTHRLEEGLLTKKGKFVLILWSGLYNKNGGLSCSLVTRQSGACLFIAIMESLQSKAVMVS